MLQKYPTLPNLAFSYPGVATGSNYPSDWTSCKSLNNRYTNSDGGKGSGWGGEDDDTEMTSFSSGGSSSPTSSSRSVQEEEEDPTGKHIINNHASFRPAANKLQRMPAHMALAPGNNHNNHIDHFGAQSACAEFDELWEPEKDGMSIESTQLSEWQSSGGLLATQAAFEGHLLFDADLDSTSEWLAPIVWKMYLRQATQCSARYRHQYDVPLDTPCPTYFPKLLTRAMPRYRGGMTRAIATTHALLYLHRIKTCFHCTTVSTTSTTPFKQQKVKYNRHSSSSSSSPSSSASSSPNCINNHHHTTSAPSASSAQEDAGLSKEQYQKAITNVAAQCSLFFAVGMHYASLWLLDCCPGEKTYWKRYVQCVQTSHGIAWSRLVLQHWNYQINVSIEDWLIFCSQLLAKFPYANDETRSRMTTGPGVSGSVNVNSIPMSMPIPIAVS